MKISDSINRVDSPDKLSGKTQYIEDVSFEGLLYARTLRSTCANGRILSIDYPPLPLGIDIVDYKDVLNNQVAMIEKDMPVFAFDEVAYIGEPIALIIGENKDQIITYMKGIKIEYDVRETVFTMLEAMKQPFIERSYEKGTLYALTEDKQYDLKISETFETGYQEQLYMEKQGVVGNLEGDVVTIYGSLQCPYYVLNALKHSTGLDADKLRVVQSPTGGAFGGKEEYPSLIACQVAAATMKLRKPIQLIFDRREDILVTTKRHPSRTLITSYIKNNQIIGMDFDISLDAGPYLGLSDVVLQRAILTMTGSYDIPNLRVKGRTLKTNNVFTGAFRGFGAPQSMYALELHMSHLARQLGVDQVTFRKAHFVSQGGITSTGGIFNEAIELEALTEKLLVLSQYEKKTDRAAPYCGYGFSIIPHGGGFTGDGEATHIKAVVKLRKEADQTVHILVSNVEMGQGAITALSKIVASALELPMDRIVYEIPDTFFVPDSGPTVASRTTMVVGALLKKAADRLKLQMNERGIVEVEEHFVQPTYVKWNQDKLNGNAYLAYSWSAILARVIVDPMTYEVTCTDIWGTYDVGRPIDMKLLAGQIHGGIAQGLGYAMMEHMTSTHGKIDQNSFSSYVIPTSMDMPNIHFDVIDNPYDDGPFGAKAVGELSIVGVAPAIAAAIEEALGGLEINEIPVTPEIIERRLLVK